jgi:cathepsin L
LVACVHIASAAPPKWHELTKSGYTFEDYARDFQKSYSTNEQEFLRRKSIFESNLDTIVKHNADETRTYNMGVNHLTDMPEPPLGYNKNMKQRDAAAAAAAATSSSRLLQNSHQMDIPFEVDDVSTLPTTVDWRSEPNVVTPVKDQGGCGSCWAFASTAVLESHVALQTGVLFELSPQELVSCCPNPRHCGGEGGCTGSIGELAMEYVATQGMVQEWQFPYQSYQGDNVTCSLVNNTAMTNTGPDPPGIKGAVVTIDGYAVLPANNYTYLMNAVAKVGPIAVSVAASNWNLYESGVFEDKSRAPTAFDINHLVALVGYGTDEETGEDYWLIRNSWRPTWGENGYIRLKRVDPATLDDPESACGIDVTPRDGDSCTIDEHGNHVVPPPQKVCGTSGVLSDSVFPMGGRLV